MSGDIVFRQEFPVNGGDFSGAGRCPAKSKIF